jgi:hypothetical protein
MASTVHVCNLALAKLGAKAIESLTENSKEARLCALFFESVRDDLLRAHPWNFAASRAALARLAEAPAFGFAAAFQLPADCLKVVGLNGDPRAVFRIEGRRLLTDLDQARIVYTARVEDPTLFDPHFVQALAARLAAELCVPIAKSAALAERLWRLAEAACERAAVEDSREGADPAPGHGSGQNPYLDARS